MPATAPERSPAPAMTALLFSADFGFKSVYLIVVVIFIGIAIAPALVGFRDRLADKQPITAAEAVSLSGFRDPTIRLAAIMTGLSFAGEVLIAEWIAIYLRDERGFSRQHRRAGGHLLWRRAHGRAAGQWSVVNRLGLKPSFQLAGHC